MADADGPIHDGLEFDAARMLRHVQGCMFLIHQWDDGMREALGEERYLRMLFNTYVVGNSVAERHYMTGKGEKRAWRKGKGADSGI